MNVQKIIDFLHDSIDPIPDSIFGNSYRASVYLKDGTYLPCVVFQSRHRRIELAIERFEEVADQPERYTSVVESFVAGGSIVAEYNIDRVVVSPFAWPLKLLKKIESTSNSSWKTFVVKMIDGKLATYRTTFAMEFFELPKDYSHLDIKKVYSGMVYSKAKGLRPFDLNDEENIEYFREKPFFICYFNGLDA